MTSLRENCRNCSETFYQQALFPLEYVDFTFGGQKITLIGCFVESPANPIIADCPKICQTCLELLRTTFSGPGHSLPNENRARKAQHMCATCFDYFPTTVLVNMNLTVINIEGRGVVKLEDCYKTCTKQELTTGGSTLVCLACVSVLASEYNNQRLDVEAIKMEPIFTETLPSDSPLACKIEPELPLESEWTDDFREDSEDREIKSEPDANQSKSHNNVKPHKRYECAFCAKLFRHKSNLVKHFKKRHVGARPPSTSETTKQFGCPVCHRKFPRKYGMERHLMNRHHSQNTYKCHHCDRFKTMDKTSMEDHLLTRHFTMEEKCLDCDEVLPNRPAYRKHATKHQAVKELRCPGCKRTFSRYQTYEKHIRTKTIVVNCQQCEAAFHSARALDIHMEIEHNKVYTCEICKFPLYKMGTYNDHKRIQHGIHSKPRCRYCGLEFETTGQLAAHRDKEHEARDYICELCGKGFLRKYTMIAHLKLHTAKASTDKLRCHLCGKELKSASSLASHMKAIHLRANQRTTKIEYTCPKCPQWKFARHQALEGHMIVHNTENRAFFQCFTCGIAYTRKQKYDVHIVKCHGFSN